MRIQVVTRHTDVPEDIRAFAEQQVARLDRYEPHLKSAEIIFDSEKRIMRTETILHVNRGEPVVAHGEGEDFRSAIAQMIKRLQKILRRRRDQATDRQAVKFTETLADEV